MRLTRLLSTCPDTESCPTLYRTDRSTAVIQGYVVTNPEVLDSLALAAGETAVKVPLDLLAGLTISGPTMCRTDHGTVLVCGIEVTDPEALATLHLPTGESAVEIRLSPPASLIKQEVPA